MFTTDKQILDQWGWILKRIHFWMRMTNLLAQITSWIQCPLLEYSHCLKQGCLEPCMRMISCPQGILHYEYSGTSDASGIPLNEEENAAKWVIHSEDEGDFTICVICLDRPVTCSFEPCGHSITCQDCSAKWIKESVNSGKSIGPECPFCRGLIDSVIYLKSSEEITF